MFFRESSDILKEHFSDKSKREAKKTYQMHMTSYFIQQKGLQNVHNLIEKMLEYEEIVPFMLLYSLVHLIQAFAGMICI